MSESAKAVFLSYASQDAEAAKRICEALRASGVEVWFDQSELVGGDAWDQSIRKQISECALFVPILSATTQGRREAYFRLEWKLADERTHLMAEGTPFLLPVTIDQTTERGALVPKSFVAVQWTRAPGGETPPAFADRVKKLLSSEPGAGSPSTSSGSGDRELEAGRPRPATAGSGDPALQKKPPRWLAPVIGGAVVTLLAVVILRPWQKAAVSQDAAKPAELAKPAAPLTEAQKLVAQARKIYEDGDELNRDNLFLAEEMVQRALALDPTEPTAWELGAWLSYMMVWHLIDESPARRETLLRQANRALALAPEAVSSQLVYANAQLAGRFMVRDAGQSHLEETEQSLRRLAEREPQNWKIPRALGTVYRLMNRTDDAIRTLERALELSGDHPMAVADLVNVYIRRQRLPEAEGLLARTLPHQRSGRLLTFDVVVKCRWRGDTAGALKAIETWPAWLLQEDRGMALAWQAGYWGHQPEAALRVVQQFPREEVRDLNFSGPRAVLSARAHEMAGNTAAAQVDWHTVVQRSDQSLAGNPQDVLALFWKAWALARLGDQSGAQAVATLLRQHLRSVASGFFNVNSAAPLWTTVGWTDLALSDLRSLLEKPVDGYSLTRAYLELEPAFDPIRQDPRFQALLAQASAPKETENREQKSAVSDSIDQKSVAVLAFANLSDDKNNEYFSDGISEELLNVLAKVPGLKVMARTSSFHFKGKDTPIADIAQQLGVAYVVEGSVRKSGDKVRITAQLIKAADGFHVWSDTFTRDLKDIFAVQDEIAGLIARNLQLKLGAAPATAPAADPEAYRLLLLGRFSAQAENNEGWTKAIESYRAALVIEPGNAMAWARMAEAYVLLARFGGLPPAEAFQQARAAAERALTINPDLPQGLVSLGWVQRTADWNWSGAELLFQRALALAPQNADILRDNAVLAINLDRVEEGMALCRQAVALDPLNAAGHVMLSRFANIAGQPEEAEREVLRALELAPRAVQYREFLARALINGDRWKEAAEAAELEVSDRYRLFARAMVQQAAGNSTAAALTRGELIEKYPDRMAAHIAMLYGQAGEADPAFRWLERAATQRETVLAFIRNEPLFRSIHRDPRWPLFMKRLGHDLTESRK